MKVELVAYTQPFKAFDEPTWNDPLGIVEECACICYDSAPTKDNRIAKSCIDSGHKSVLEHVSFTFYIQDVSRALLAELSRHRHISLSVRSTRYCDESDFKWVHIDTNTVDDDEAISGMMWKLQGIYEDFTKNKTATKDEMRGILPLALCTELYMTANARALIEMAYLRLCNRAHREIREMFQEIKKQVAIVSPEIAEYMRPKCEADIKHPFCVEKNGCGKHKHIMEVYKDEKI